MESFLCNFQKNIFLLFNVPTDLGGCIIKYNTLLPSCAAVERLISRGAAILQAKRASLTSTNFERLVFLKGNLHFLKRQGVAQDDFDDMPSTSSIA